MKEASEGLHSIANQERGTQKIILELAVDESELHQHMPRQIRQVLEGKQLLVFKEMLASQGHADASIVDETAQYLATFLKRVCLGPRLCLLQ